MDDVLQKKKRLKRKIPKSCEQIFSLGYHQFFFCLVIPLCRMDTQNTLRGRFRKHRKIKKIKSVTVH